MVATSWTPITQVTATTMPSAAIGPPTETRSMHGSTPTSVATSATIPIPAFAIMFSPHVRLNSSAERFTAWIGPICSMTITGRTRNVTSDHASPISDPTIRPMSGERSSIARRIIVTVALRTAQGSNTCARAPAARTASPIVTGSPRSRLSAANTSAALKKTMTYVTTM